MILNSNLEMKAEQWSDCWKEKWFKNIGFYCLFSHYQSSRIQQIHWVTLFSKIHLKKPIKITCFCCLNSVQSAIWVVCFIHQLFVPQKIQTLEKSTSPTFWVFTTLSVCDRIVLLWNFSPFVILCCFFISVNKYK